MNHYNKPEAHIENWVYDGSRLYGTVTGHNDQHQFSASYQMTSHVIELNAAEHYAATENTYYTLGQSGDYEEMLITTRKETK